MEINCLCYCSIFQVSQNCIKLAKPSFEKAYAKCSFPAFPRGWTGVYENRMQLSSTIFFQLNKGMSTRRYGSLGLIHGYQTDKSEEVSRQEKYEQRYGVMNIYRFGEKLSTSRLLMWGYVGNRKNKSYSTDFLNHNSTLSSFLANSNFPGTTRVLTNLLYSAELLTLVLPWIWIYMDIHGYNNLGQYKILYNNKLVF